MESPVPWTTVVGSLPLHDFVVELSVATRSVVLQFEQQPSLPGVLLRERGEIAGLVSREKCFQQLSRSFGQEVFLGRPIRMLHDSIGLTFTRLPADMPVDRAVQLALSRPPDQIYEPLAIQRANLGWAILDMPRLLTAQSALLASVNKLISQQVQIGRALSTSLQLDHVLDVILENILDIVPYDRAAVLVAEEEKLAVAASRGQPTRSDSAQEHLVSSAGVWQDVLTTRQPLCLADLSQSPHDALALAWPEARALLGVPLVHANSLVGVLALARDQVGVYGDHELTMAQTIAGQAAAALQNARLFEMVQRLAMTDPLTQLFNRRRLFELAQEEFERAMRYGRELAVLMLDADHFKRINDEYGHVIGDQVLGLLAKRCRGELRGIDIIGRYGGEEFMVVMPETGLLQAVRTAERLRQSVADLPFHPNVGELFLSISLGVTSLPKQADTTLEVLIGRADRALYTAKNTGRNRVTAWSPGQPDSSTTLDAPPTHNA